GALAMTQPASLSWAAAVSGNWGVNSNWTPSGFPNNNGPNTFNAFITIAGPAYTVSLDQNITIENLTQSSAAATLDLAGFTLHLNGGLTLTNSVLTDSLGTGTLQSAGATTIGD